MWNEDKFVACKTIIELEGTQLKKIYINRLKSKLIWQCNCVFASFSGL